MVSERMTPNERRAAALVFAVTVCLYARTIGFEFVFDDRALLGPEGPIRLGGALVYRPLRYGSYRFDAWLGGGDAWAYHLVNVLIHGAVATLVLRIGLRLGLGCMGAALAALVASTHPLAVEAVAYVAGRRDLLAVFCGLAALNLWIELGSKPVGRNALVVVALLVASTAAKESGLVFVFVCAVASCAGLAPGGRRAGAALACAAVLGAVLILAYGGAAAFMPASGRSLLATGPHLIRHYFSGLLALRSFSADYPEFVSAGPALAAEPTVSAAAVSVAAIMLPLVALVLAAWVLHRLHHRSAALVIGWFTVVFASIVLVGGFHEPGADRHAYPLLVPVGLALGLAVSAILGRSAFRAGPGPVVWQNRIEAACPRSLGAVPAAALACGLLAVALVFACAHTAFVQSEVWRNEESLWRATLAARPGSMRAHINLAAVYSERGRSGRARRHLERALGLRDDYGPAHLGLAYLSCLNGRRQAAEVHLARAGACGLNGEPVAAVRRVCAESARRRDPDD